MRLNTKNMARTTLTKDIGTTDTSFTVADANVLPDPPFRMTVENEIMEVGAKNVSTKTLSSVLRGQEGTTATAHANGSIVENRFTAGTYDEIKQTMGPLASLITRIKTSIVNALNGLQEDFNSHKAENVSYLSTEYARDMSLTGVQTITGLPFVPELILVEGAINNTKKASLGSKTSTRQLALYTVEATGNWLRSGARSVAIADTIANITYGNIIIKQDKTIDIEWTHAGTGATGTLVFTITAFKHGGGA